MKNLSKTLFMLLGVTIAVTFSGCSDEESGPKPKEFEPIPISRSEETIVRADNNFAYKFLRRWMSVLQSMRIMSYRL